MARPKKPILSNVKAIKFSDAELKALQSLAKQRGIPFHRMVRKCVLALVDVEDLAA